MGGVKGHQGLRSEPSKLVEKLAALVPPPRVNLVRYHGVLAPAAWHRSRVVPEVEKPEDQEEKTDSADPVLPDT